MHDVSRREFLRDIGGIALLYLGATNIASAFDGNVQASLTDKQKYIIETMREMPAGSSNINGKWYNIHEMRFGYGESRFAVQLADSYISMLSFADNAQSFYDTITEDKVDGKKHLAVKNKKMIPASDLDSVIGDFAKIVDNPSYQSKWIALDQQPDQKFYEILVTTAYDSLKQQQKKE